ncbi:T9SS type A sorting domain-containing protein [Terrimonas pollutisoli]|uniref:T9SS type A sorting domain-containing protein n=1 Tax=Terrimonas pollutisoli TaxID=3034147 RepID=UPI0023EC8FEA|nr:T9SS type A sorting domain-containing protein [Terrimonas sp. H1YJ31]
MKLTVLLTAFLLMACFSKAQIVTPFIKANFGVDADLKANFFNGSLSPGNDDWFNDGTPGTGVFVIDTTGAAAMMSQYIADPTLRKKSFTRGMNYPMYSTVNGKLLYDALYVRDHNKNDSTAFVSSNKNGESPAIWSGATTPIPVKNDINDVMVHVRRDGPALTDSLWFFAGVSIHGSTGSRYFDFELYQTDIFFNKADSSFYNYGAEAGHTAWQFDAVGNVTRPGDVIFTAEFSNAGLELLEARIWIDKSSLSLTPAPFSWNGAFDGDGTSAQYGYASIKPKTGGIFYGGNQCTNNTWGGPFGFVDVTNVSITNYASPDFMEIAVNMTKLGLDPYTILGSSCNLSFRKVFAKTRSSNSFTSSLQDFVGPYSIARPETAAVTGNLSLFCGSGPGFSQLSVTNPLSTSTYTWSTPNGNIVTTPAEGTTIVANMPGTYIVNQTLISGCSSYSTDTIVLIKDLTRCMILAAEDLQLNAKSNNSDVLLTWTSTAKDVLKYEVERSIDNRSFQTIGSINATSNSVAEKNYQAIDQINHLNAGKIYYRLKITSTNFLVNYSQTISIKNNNGLAADFTITPNPASDYLQIGFRKIMKAGMSVKIYNNLGTEVRSLQLKNENEKISLRQLTPGIYIIQAFAADGSFKAQQKLLVAR